MLWRVQDIINSRLWSSVRDQLNLTYEVSCELNQFDRLNASWWCVSVTATPAKITAATQASLDVLRGMKVRAVQLPWLTAVVYLHVVCINHGR